ncbi:MAG: prepilin peptidase [Pirellulaceae bacterium]
MDPSSATTNTSASEDEASEFESLDTATDEASSKPLWMRYPGRLLLGIGFLIYMVIVPTVAMVIDWLTPAVSGEVKEMTFFESLQLRTVSCVVTFWFVGVGASIGSFLNVVIFRLPRKRPLLWPPSACANCQTRLKGKDNIPILAWMKLGGRCRYCDVPISARYPLVEAIVAMVFVVFFFRELLSGGANLPVRSANFYNGIVWTLLYPKWDLVSLYFFHMTLLVILLAWGMINYDRFRVPWLSVLVSLAAFIGLTSVFPHLNPVHKSWTSALPSIPQSVSSSLIGCLTGYGMGFALSRVAAFRLPPIAPNSLFEERCEDDENASAVPAVESRVAVGGGVLDDQAPGEAIPVQGVVDGDLERSEGSSDLYGSVAIEPGSNVDVAASLALVGAAMGLQAVVVVAILALVLTLLLKFSRPILPAALRTQRPLPSTVYVAASAFILLFVWDPIHDGISQLF